jgi:polyphosphate kinase
MEVKARFDEENNLIWAQRMEEAGIKIRYSMPGLKVHAKVALVRRESKDKTYFYGFFGTGNLNESTAKIYCDHGLLTSNQEMTEELNRVFTFLINKEEPAPFEHLIVSQFGATERFKELIDQEIKAVEEGRTGHVIIKVNNLEEPRLIKKLYKAAKVGVKVEVIARSICCLVPETHGIKVSRIVDRYLEHARIFYFYNDGNPNVYLGSSDWMKRNLRRRIEVTFPIHDSEIKQQIIRILELQLRDNSKRVLLDENISNVFP